MPTQPCNNQQTISDTTTVTASDESKPSSEKQKERAPDRKFNIVMYGVKESPVNTSWSTRLDHDIANITNVFSQTSFPVERQSIKDCRRLNSNATKPRPILVSSLRSIVRLKWLAEYSD